MLSTWPSIPFGFSTFAFPGVFEDDEEEVLAVLFFVDVANLLAALFLADAEDDADGLLTARFFADDLVGASFIADVAEDDEPVAFFFDFPIVREPTLTYCCVRVIDITRTSFAVLRRQIDLLLISLGVVLVVVVCLLSCISTSTS